MLTFVNNGITFMKTGTHFINGKWFHDIKNLTTNEHYLLVSDEIINKYF